MGPSTGKCFVYLYVVLINTFRVPDIDQVDFPSLVSSSSLYAGKTKNKLLIRNLHLSSPYLHEQTKNENRNKNSSPQMVEEKGSSQWKSNLVTTTSEKEQIPVIANNKQ